MNPKLRFTVYDPTGEIKLDLTRVFQVNIQGCILRCQYLDEYNTLQEMRIPATIDDYVEVKPNFTA